MTTMKHPGQWFSTDSDGRLLCELCPRACRLKPGDRGFCFVRQNDNGTMVLDTYGKSTGFCIDPIEKKPLNHFLPGTPVLSFGTAGCNLGCKFCQNWDISKSREVARLSSIALPDAIAQAAMNAGCRSVAFTYNDPVIWAEYAIDTARACHDLGIKTVAVTAGYICERPRVEFFSHMDAANIDLKAFTEDFYYHVTSSHLAPVLDTIRYVCNETPCHVELTNLVIPDANDSLDEIRRMCEWILEEIGDKVPLHFTAFHPDYRMTDRPHTPHETLIRVFDLARAAGLRYVYVGNVHDTPRQSTYCHGCGECLVERDWHQIHRYALNENQCVHCGTVIPGVFETTPGNWGRKRLPILIPTHSTNTLEPAMTDLHHTPSDATSFTESELETIHLAASRCVASTVLGSPTIDIRETLGDLAKRPVSGVYVTLKRGSTLRGCCGSQGSTRSLAETLVDSAVRTAREDPRMPPVSPVELPFLELTVSVLGPPEKLVSRGEERAGDIVIGKHGVRLRAGEAVGLLLPSVATEQGWTSRQFLDGVCRKAGVPAGAWLGDDVEVWRFAGVSLTSPIVFDGELADRSRLVSDDELKGLEAWMQQNLFAIQSGATPFYYAPGLADTNVVGVAVRVRLQHTTQSRSWMHLNLRESVPLQATLFQLTQQIASSLPSQTRADAYSVELAVLSDCVHHGTLGVADWRGIDAQQRSIVVTDGRRWSLVYDRRLQAGQLQTHEALVKITRPHSAQLYSLRCDTRADDFEIHIAPQARAHVTSRSPAVAGAFYPAEEAARETLVDSLLNGLEPVEKCHVSSVMVPHAGLRYSGRIAADVWRRIEIPRTVIIIGPKHTADGVDWAVAPHDRWMLSTAASINGAPEIAASLVEAVAGMELDSGAHQREHAIEVQLPFLYRLAPASRMIGIAMHGGTMDELRHAAKSLATWIKTLEQPPLLVISSDMNHFAEERENRRRDRMALDAMQSLDAEKLLAVCEAESISMCGQVPAALVLLTLQALGLRPVYREIAYGTSADITGETSRVVGYAGVLL